MKVNLELSSLEHGFWICHVTVVWIQMSNINSLILSLCAFKMKAEIPMPQQGRSIQNQLAKFMEFRRFSLNFSFSFSSRRKSRIFWLTLLSIALLGWLAEENLLQIFKAWLNDSLLGHSSMLIPFNVCCFYQLGF